jgi:uncharacterized metal-binding protein YceD (DUF177 family)
MAQQPSQPVRPEFSRVLLVDRNVPPKQPFHIEANAEERAALARRFALVALDALKAEGSLETLDNGRRAVLRAHLTAKVTQSCVVSLAPVAAEIDEEFTLEYDADADPAALDAPEIPEDMEDMEAFLEEPDPPDPLVDGAVDVGEAVAEHLALALDPYPRAPGVVFESSTAPDSLEESPFKALAGLVKKDRS